MWSSTKNKPFNTKEKQLNIVLKHDNKESRTYTADTESFCPLKGSTERKFENGLGVVVSI